MKAYFWRLMIGLFLGGITIGVQAQCTSTLSFGQTDAPSVSRDSILLSPCVLFTEFAVLTNVQAGETYTIIMSGNTHLSIYSGPNTVLGNFVTSGMASPSFSFVAPVTGNYDIVFHQDATCSNQLSAVCLTSEVACPTCPNPIETDSCQNATLLAAGSYAFNSLNASGEDVSSCVNGDSLDVWVKYSPTRSGVAGFTTCGSSFNTSLQVYDDCPQNGGIELACNDNHGGLAAIGGVSCQEINSSSVYLLVTAGSTYYIRLSGPAGATGAGKLNITAPPVASGSNCSNPFVLRPGTNNLIKNLNTHTGTFSSTDQLCSNGGTNTGIFFRLEVPSCGEIELNMRHNASPFNWFLLSGDCSGFSVNSSNQASIATSGCATGSVTFRDTAAWINSSTQGSRFSFPAEYILYIEASGNEGALNLSYNLNNSAPAPLNDRCATPYALSQGDGFSFTNSNRESHVASNRCANTDASDNNQTSTIKPSAACNISWENTLWYEWTAPVSKSYTLRLFNQSCTARPLSSGTGLDFLLTTVKDCTDPALTSAGIVSDVTGVNCFSSGSSADVAFTFMATQGETYFLLVDGFEGALCDFELLMSPTQPLNAESIVFEGWSEPQRNLLRWSMPPEEDMRAFEVERSIDGQFFTKIGSVEVTEDQFQYHFADMAPHTGRQYYRLRVLYPDGSSQFSSLVEILHDSDPFGLWPLEEGKQLRIALGLEALPARLEILNAAGQVIWKNAWAAHQSRQFVLTPSLPTGIFFYRLIAGRKQVSGKFIRY
jgi:hypothetical protein